MLENSYRNYYFEVTLSQNNMEFTFCCFRGIVESSAAQEARCKLQSLNNRLFEELCSDIYDEVDRRENDAGLFNYSWITGLLVL